MRESQTRPGRRVDILHRTKRGGSAVWTVYGPEAACAALANLSRRRIQARAIIRSDDPTFEGEEVGESCRHPDLDAGWIWYLDAEACLGPLRGPSLESDPY